MSNIQNYAINRSEYKNNCKCQKNHKKILNTKLNTNCHNCKKSFCCNGIACQMDEHYIEYGGNKHKKYGKIL